MVDLKIIENPVKGRICVVVGTRPGIIKMSPIIRELKQRNVDFFVLHAGQHYSYEMDKKFFEDLELDEPEYKLQGLEKCVLHGEQTAEMLKGIEKILIKEKPEIVLVCGDANYSLAGALVARKLRLKVGHVEAGCRSYDWRMPEEHNRVIIDHISDYLFAPTKEAKNNLTRESVRGKIFVTGNTIVDAVLWIRDKAEKSSKMLKELGLKCNEYFLMTVHREENVDVKKNLEGIIQGIKLISDEFNLPIVYPIHPRTRKRLKQFGLEEKVKNIENLKIINPIGYIDFIALLSKAKLVLTDSGGVQQESCILKVPCVTLRETTEMPETLEIGSNILAGTDPEKIRECVEKMLNTERNWENPFGDGRAGEKIVDVLVN